MIYYGDPICLQWAWPSRKGPDVKVFYPLSYSHTFFWSDNHNTPENETCPSRWFWLKILSLWGTVMKDPDIEISLWCVLCLHHFELMWTRQVGPLSIYRPLPLFCIPPRSRSMSLSSGVSLSHIPETRDLKMCPGDPSSMDRVVVLIPCVMDLYTLSWWFVVWWP